jgi:hypothetical protein
MEALYAPLTEKLIKRQGFGPVVDEMFALTAEQLLDTTTLPQATLRSLAAKGVILSVMTFEDFMSPEVHWIEPEEFGRAFEELINGEKPMPDADDTRFEAAHTSTANPFPAHINARRGEVPGTVRITIRSACQVDGSDLVGGTSGNIEMDLQDFDQWIADAQRLRQALG